MKHTAFARFDTPEAAERCLKRLHQLEVLGRKLVVEYAKTDQAKNFPQDLDSDKPKEEKESEIEDKNKTVDFPKLEQPNDPTFEKHGIQYPRKPTLLYLYPPPTVSTLTNIANALASHPKFYTQVLHLMNKMNLPCPFGAVTASPPLALDNPSLGERQGYKGRQNEVIAGEINEIEMEQESTEESEIESDDGSSIKPGEKRTEESVKMRKSVKRPRKKMKLVQPDMSAIIKPSMIVTPAEVFENIEIKSKQISVNISATPLYDNASVSAKQTEKSALPVAEESVTVLEGGFGKVEPQAKAEKLENVQKPDTNYTIDHKQFVSQDKVSAGRLKQSQFKDFSVFKNYSTGECTSRLYIKNLTKHTTEQELVNLFGSFVNWSIPMAYDTFDIRLMKEGRMKGQAFVTLPDEESAQCIVTECNGYIHNNKPMVIQFARSAKAKEVDIPVAE